MAPQLLGPADILQPATEELGMYLFAFLWAFALTLAVELPIMYVLLARKSSIRLILTMGVAANACTLPVVWFVYPLWLEGLPYVLTSEVFAVGVECVIIRFGLHIDWRSALLVSILMNLCSFVVGLALSTVFSPLWWLPS